MTAGPFLPSKTPAAERLGLMGPVRGTLVAKRPLADLTWLRVGGPAEWLFQPADEADLSAFLAALDPKVAVFPIGVGSNLIIRDGGFRGVVVRLGSGFRQMAFEGDTIRVGAAVLDAQLALRAAEHGFDLTFLRTIPGTIGGNVRMNAGCYGTYVADVLESVRIITRAGEILDLPAKSLNLRYRAADLPEGAVIVEARLCPPRGKPEDLLARMQAQLAKRDATQPVRERTAGSTFRNPSGQSSTGAAGENHALKAWALIDAVGMRGARLGGAQISPKHANFLINTGTATAAELEALGEAVRKRVLEYCGIALEWEIIRLGEPLLAADPSARET